MKKPGCLIFDLDNTLYEYNGPNEISNNVVFGFLSKKFSLSIEEVKKIHGKARDQTHIDLSGQAASHNRVLYFQKTLELLGFNSMKQTLELYNLYWDTFLNEMKLAEDVKDVLAEVKSKGIKTCILTDLTAHIQFRKIETTGIDKYFDFLVTSEEVGHEKPHPLMFEKALEKLKTNKENVIMIGDNWENDIEGAESFGIKSIWINHKNEVKDIPESVTAVKNFSEIKNILKTWN